MAVSIVTEHFKCNVVGCDNTARYVAIGNDHGNDGQPRAFFSCGTCPIRYGFESVRFTDLGEFMAAAIRILRASRDECGPEEWVALVAESFSKMLTILGREP